MRETELAIAMSARDWPDVLRRFLADHGGARVRIAAMGPEDLLAESYDVLLIDDICSFLTPRLVDLVTGRGRAVIGVYDRAEFADGAERMREFGVVDVIDADAAPDEFLEVIGRVARLHPATTDEAEPAPPEASVDSRPAVLAVGGPAGGVGSTEVAISMASRLARRGPTVLVDADDNAPAIAQRLGLPLYPNIRTAIDALEHRTGTLERVLHAVSGEEMTVLPGLASVGDWSEVRPRQLVDLVRELADGHEHVVVNVGSRLDPDPFGDAGGRHGVSRAVVAAADRLVAVGLGTPVGVARLLDWIAVAESLRDGGAIDILVNRAPGDAFRRGELLEEITRTYRPSSFSFLPEDGRMALIAWDGAVPDRGRFRRSVDRWVDQFVPRAA